MYRLNKLVSYPGLTNPLPMFLKRQFSIPTTSSRLQVLVPRQSTYRVLFHSPPISMEPLWLQVTRFPFSRLKKSSSPVSLSANLMVQYKAST